MASRDVDTTWPMAQPTSQPVLIRPLNIRQYAYTGRGHKVYLALMNAIVSNNNCGNSFD